VMVGTTGPFPTGVNGSREEAIGFYCGFEAV
jgi:hypothetical protein